MLKIWGRITSINVQKVMWAVAELGLPHQRIDAGLHFGGNNEDWYRAMNPNGRVPVIDDEGFVLWESNAIVRYLAARHAGPSGNNAAQGSSVSPETGTPPANALWPANVQVRADADRWMDWATTTMHPVMTPLFWGLIRTPPEKRDAAALDKLRLQMEDVMQILDQQLAARPYLAGDTFSMGDIPVGCFVQRWLALPMAHGEHSHLMRWIERLSVREGFIKHVRMELA